VTRRRLSALIHFGFVCAFVCAFIYAFPYWSGLRNANEMPRVMLTLEIVERGTFRLDARWPQLSMGSTFDVAVTPDGHQYSNKAPGPSFVGVPAYLALKAFHRIAGGAPTWSETMWACRFAASILPTLLFLPLFRRTARRFASEPAADAALVALAFGSMVYPYAQLFFSHALAAACAGGAFALAIAVVRDDTTRPVLAALGVGFLLGWAVLADYQSALALVIVGGYVAAHRPRALLGIVAGGLPPALLLGFYHWTCFGAPWRTGYSFAADPAQHQGVLGVTRPNLQAMSQALVTPDNGLLVLMPWVALSVVGAVVLWRRRVWRPEAVAAALVAVSYVLFVGSLVPEFGRAGASVGPRYIAGSVPFFAWLLAAALDAVDGRAWLRAGAHGLILAAVVIMVTATTTFPYWPPSIQNPVHEIAFWALSRGRVSPSFGSVIGLRGAAAVVPLYLLVAALAWILLARRQRGRHLTTAAAALIAALWVGALGFAPRTFDLPNRRDFLEGYWPTARRVDHRSPAH
jgi:hypothetical protein